MRSDAAARVRRHSSNATAASTAKSVAARSLYATDSSQLNRGSAARIATASRPARVEAERAIAKTASAVSTPNWRWISFASAPESSDSAIRYSISTVCGNALCGNSGVTTMRLRNRYRSGKARWYANASHP